MACNDSFRSLSGRSFDVVVIGGGINGVAGARHMAARGLDVLLVEKGDYGSGASSRSSRLQHCGLRYLAPGHSPWEFLFHPSRLATGLKMARQAVIARDAFVQSTPDRTRKCRLFFPIYEKGPYSGWQVDAAFGILSAFNRGRTPLHYRRIPGEEARNIPLVNRLRDYTAIESFATYDEYQISWPERITVDLAIDARRLGATVLNYCRATLDTKSASGWQLNLEDEDGSQAIVTAKAVVTAAGLWIDDVLSQHRRGKPKKVVGTKGSHIVVELPPECQDIGIATINSKNEPFYCLPWGIYHYIGPTEVRYEGDPDRITTTWAERDWLLTEANRLLPTLKLTERDVRHTWSGVRPLTFDPALPNGNRRRILHNLSSDGLEGVFALTGGPLMTHDSAGIEIADAVQRLLPSRATKEWMRHHSSFPNPEHADLIPALSGRTEAPPWLDRMLAHEQVRHLSDIVLRRCGLPWFGRLDAAALEAIARNLGPRLGWSDARIGEEVIRCRRELAILQFAEM